MTRHEQDNDPRLASLLHEARDSFRVPTDPPLEAMWGRIEQAHFGAPVDPDIQPARTSPARRSAAGRLRHWGMLAATLVLGIAIGRLGMGPLSPATHDGRAGDQVVASEAANPELDQAMTEHLGQTAALLVALPTEPSSADMTRALATRAAELLSNTRVLLDSETSSSDAARSLLEDLELVLAQIVRLHGGQTEDLDLINQALEQRDVLPRLQLAVASNVTSTE